MGIFGGIGLVRAEFIEIIIGSRILISCRPFVGAKETGLDIRQFTPWLSRQGGQPTRREQAGGGGRRGLQEAAALLVDLERGYLRGLNSGRFLDEHRGGPK
jgi:hypothetical protein